MLYTPPAFRESDPAKLHEHILACSLAMLVTASDAGPLVSHLPFILEPETGPHGELIGHLARANPQWRASDLGKPALAVFMGPDAYVSPSWYASKKTDPRVVPTWNYVAVYARGRLEVFEDAERLKAVVTRLTERHEAGFSAPWQVSDAPADFLARMLRGIVGVRLVIEEIEGKRKLSQNRSAADREGVIAGLGMSERAADREVAQLMQTAMPAAAK
jgi:transcriptional regulator